MPTIRRLYLYLVALLGLMVSMVGLINISAGLIRLWLNAQPWQITGAELAGSDLARWAGAVLIAGPAWFIHWYLANRRARTLTMAGAVERSAAVRKAYLYAGQFGALVAIVVQAGLLSYDLLLGAMGGSGISGEWPAGPLVLTAGLSIALLVWIGLRTTTRRDGDMGHEPGAGAGWRRTYDYLGAALGSALTIAGAGLFVLVVLRLVSLSSGLSLAGVWREGVAASLSALLVGVPLAILSWRRADWAAADDPAGVEVNSLGRKVVLYAGLLAGAGGTVVCTAYLVAILVMLILGQPVDNLRGLWDQTVAPPLAFLPVCWVTWWSFGRAVRNDILWAPESADAATFRRLYFYLMAGITLAAFWWGLQQVLAIALFLLLGLQAPSALATPAARNTLGLALALMAAAGPAWWWHWQRAQQWARWPGAEGREERTSALRKIYLYGAILASAVVVVGTLGFVIYQSPAWLFGPGAQGQFEVGLVQFGVAVGLALLVWLSLGLVMREDTRLNAGERVNSSAAGQESAPSGTEMSVAKAVPSLPAVPAVAPAGGVAEGGLRPGQFDRASLQALRGLPAEDLRAGLTAVASGGSGVAGAPAVGGTVADEAPVNTAVGVARVPQQAAGSSAGAPNGAKQPVARHENAEEPAPDRSTETSPAVAVVDGGDGATGAALVRALQQALPGLRVWPLGLNPGAQSAMVAALAERGEDGRAPADALTRAKVILGRTDILIAGGLGGDVLPGLVAEVINSPARKVLLPPSDARLRWVAAPAWPAERWVEQAVAEVARVNLES